MGIQGNGMTISIKDGHGILILNNNLPSISMTPYDAPQSRPILEIDLTELPAIWARK